MALFAQVGDADEAEAAAAAGVDGIFVQGREAGGHVKATRPLTETLAETAKAVRPLPVIASGGIANGAQIARALAAGASAVSLGTRYLVTPEARVVPEYKRRVLAAKAADTVLTQLYDVGWPDANHRVLRNGVYREWEAAGEPRSGSRPGEGKTVGRVPVANETVDLPRYTVMPPVSGFEGDLDEVPLYAGESCEWVDGSLPAGELTRQLDREWRAVRAAPER